MALSVKLARRGRRTWQGGLCVGAMILTSALLGGCNSAEKDENARLKTENAALAQENSQQKATIEQFAARPLGPNDIVDNQPDKPGRNQVKPTRDREVRIAVAGDVLFDPGQATLKAGAKKELDKVVSTIKSKYSGHSIRVEGYTDPDPIKKAKFASNEALSQARAEAVEKYLVSKGVGGDRISAMGMGAAKPKATKKDSRRVEIVILG